MTTWKGIPLTTVPRTLVDLAATLVFDDLARACHEAAFTTARPRPRLTPCSPRCPNRPGAGDLRRILRGEARTTLSALEKQFRVLLRQASLPLPETNRPAGSKRVDCRWPERRLTVELDGYRYHSSRHAWEQDRRREREARARGDKFRRCTYGDVVEDRRFILGELRRLLVSPEGLSIDWSHELLPGEERALFRRLAVFPDSFTVDAAASVCAREEIAADDVPELLARLVYKSLLTADDGSLGIRYRMLETIRAYAGGRLEEAGGSSALRDSHARCYLALAEEAEPALTGSDQARWFERLETERANLRAAVKWSIGHGRGDWALRLVGSLVLFWRIRCHFSEGRDLLEAALAGSDDATDGLRARALWGAGFMAVMLGDADGAIPQLQDSAALFRRLRDRRGLARALLILANTTYARGDDAVVPLLEESATEARAADDSWCLSHALCMAGWEYFYRDEPEPARPLFEEGLAVARDAGDKQGLRMGLLGLGSVAGKQGDYAAAEPAFEEVLVLAEELGETYTQSLALLYLGQNALGRGDYARSAALLDSAVAVTRQVNPGGLMAPLVSRAMVARIQGEPLKARELLEEALSLVPRGVPGRAAALVGMGELTAEEGDRRAASRLLEEALDVARQDGDARKVAGALHALGELARVNGDIEGAASLHGEALERRRRSRNGPGMVASIEVLATMEAAAGRAEQAARLLGAAQAARTRNEWTRFPWEMRVHEQAMDLLAQSLDRQQIDAILGDAGTLSLEEAARAASDAQPSGWASLTDKEREIASLVAEGLTNPEVAERLIISPFTVKVHVSNIFRKLGMTRRSELAKLHMNGERSR